MYTGGSDYTPRVANILRYAGLLIPIVLLSYGVLIQAGLAPGSHYQGHGVFFAIAFWWMIISLIQFIAPSKTAFDSALRLGGYHILAAGYLLFVSGVSTPFVACWILLLIASNVYFSRAGLWGSLLVFALIIVINSSFWYATDVHIVLRNLVAFVAVSLSGLVTLSVSRAQGVDRHELSRIKEREGFQRDRILTIVNNLADAILSTDAKGIVRVYNASALNLLDTNDSLNGHHIDEILHMTDEEGKKIAVFDLLRGTRSVITRDDLRYTFDDGEQIRLEITYSPIRGSYSKRISSTAHDGYIVIMRDVTKAKSLEEERDEFISVVSHELRTPITIIEGTISNVQLMMNRPDIETSQLKSAVDMAHDQAIFLARMVNDLSTLSRAERGIADNAERINVRELAHALHTKYASEASQKKLLFDLDISPVLGDVQVSRLYLEELLQNFITNAIKYTKKGTITLRIKQHQGIITFAVKDSGIGISKSDQAKVFHKFYRSEDYRTRETGGTGLGLYVATKLSKKLHTTIELTSRLNYGSTFSFTLPVAPKDKDTDATQ